MSDDYSEIHKTFEKIDQLSEHIIDRREQNVHLDTKRQGNREALSALKSTIYDPHAAASKLGSNYVNVKNSSSLFYLSGGLFLKLNVNQIQNSITLEQQRIEEEIEKNTKILKDAVTELMSYEGRADEAESFNLLPVK